MQLFYSIYSINSRKKHLHIVLLKKIKVLNPRYFLDFFLAICLNKSQLFHFGNNYLIVLSLYDHALYFSHNINGFLYFPKKNIYIILEKYIFCLYILGRGFEIPCPRQPFQADFGCGLLAPKKKKKKKSSDTMQAQIETSLCNKNVLTMRWKFSDMKRRFLGSLHPKSNHSH